MSTNALEISTENSEPTHCKNCAAPLHGHYCAHCGQADRPLDPGLGDLLHETVHEFAHLDGKILTTLKALVFFPGRLSTEFLAGKRARFIGPIRLYLTMSVLFFLLVAHKTDKTATASPADKQEVSISLDDKDSSTPQWLTQSIKKAVDDPHTFYRELLANLSHVMFLLVPLFALALRLIYYKRSLRYPSYVYFSLHYHAFVFLLFSVMVLVGLLKIGGLNKAVAWLVFFGVPLYLFAAMRRVFGGTRRRTVLRIAALGAFYFPCLFVGMIAALCLTILRG
jgi:hypothetical protein